MKTDILIASEQCFIATIDNQPNAEMVDDCMQTVFLRAGEVNIARVSLPCQGAKGSFSLERKKTIGANYMLLFLS